MIALALSIFIGYLNVRRTKHGYRYSLAVIALGAVLTSLTLGVGLYAIGFGSRIDEIMAEAILVLSAYSCRGAFVVARAGTGSSSASRQVVGVARIFLLS